MKDKGHFLVSVAKSLIRLAGGGALLRSLLILMFRKGWLDWEELMFGLFFFAVSFILAEFLGLLEEVVDKR